MPQVVPFHGLHRAALILQITCSAIDLALRMTVC